MPTKARRLREAKREAEETELDALLGCKPTFMSNQVTTGVASIDNLRSNGAHNLGKGLVSWDDEGYVFINSAAIASRADTANVKRADTREVKADALRQEYPNHWKRGGAKFIAMTETENGNKITARTVTGYIKDFPKD